MSKLTQSLDIIRPFLSRIQFALMKTGASDVEGNYFRDKIHTLAKLIEHMPRTHGQDGLGDQAIAYLHYFKGGADWYITELDIETPDEPGQHQAFGLVNLGHGAELGYISIPELVANGVELDLHFSPTTLATLKKAA
jgi:hypothetical protein